MLTIIVATDKNRVIGRENKIPWRVRSDLVRLSSLTRGHTVILGRTTYESMVWYYNKSGRQMPGGTYIVVTHQAGYVPARENTQVAHSVPDALSLAQNLGDQPIFIIGGSSIFAEALPHVQQILLTEVQALVDGDSYFPELSPHEWREVSREHHPKTDGDDYDTDYIVLERIKD